VGVGVEEALGGLWALLTWGVEGGASPGLSVASVGGLFRRRGVAVFVGVSWARCNCVSLGLALGRRGAARVGGCLTVAPGVASVYVAAAVFCVGRCVCFKLFS
jgi:hypothetical protein